MFSNNKHKVLNCLSQIENAISMLNEWNVNIHSVDDFLLSSDGMKDLAANCMLIEAIGEEFKKIDKLTDKKLLPLYPSVPWDDVKGMRDHIAHGYFDIDADIVFNVVKCQLGPLLEGVLFFKKYLNKYNTSF